MRVYIMRHGIAIGREDPKCPPEAERYLTPKGMERTREAARGLRALGARPAVWLTSPYARAVQTGEIVCKAFGANPNGLRRTDSLKPDAKPTRLLEELSGLHEDEVICFGHAPHVDEFIAHAVRAGSAFTALKKAGVACLERGPSVPHRAILLWLLTAKTLRFLSDRNE